jgi:hypothetical protein
METMVENELEYLDGMETTCGVDIPQRGAAMMFS